ncbi:hypothetical protein QNE85_001952 [Vibrio fluvialis]|nr:MULTISPECIES: hypothetical protein [Vibrio]TNF11046.1 MAG: hypothetical protein EP325_15785 [Vibrionaceae bacterium]HDM8033627.1 hypothetical protein [Vibrio fluvialis clinical-1]EKO3373541.1 hypothetical protein [Vibrio fluvialis]EKO3378029.1 hypothetical protein [Vibrio fluvialis]EKO3379643.1 hypothetical protein [Vibrio fluvialis]
MVKRVWFIVIGFFLLWSTAAYPEPYAIVTLNPNLPPLKSSQVKMLYRGRLSHIDEYNISLLDLPHSSPLREQFYYGLLGKSPAQMQAIWARQTFSGRSKAPFEAKSSSMEEIMAWLTHNKNGIAYVPASWVNESVNVIYVFDSEEGL